MKIRSIRFTRSSARTVCTSIGAPATGMYCLGLALPMRRPTPAAGMRAKSRVFRTSEKF